MTPAPIHYRLSTQALTKSIRQNMETWKPINCNSLDSQIECVMLQPGSRPICEILRVFLYFCQQFNETITTTVSICRYHDQERKQNRLIFVFNAWIN